jgi:thiosulfate/3-mercaptopyruvate sulfurtransferase
MEYSTLIDAAALQKRIGATGFAVVDCRFDLAQPGAGKAAYLSAHVSGARYADLNLDLAAPPGAHTGRHPLPSPAAFAARLGALGIGNDTEVVAYDDSGGAYAARLWWMLRWLGHRRAAVLDGGFQAWLHEGGAVASGESATLPRVFTPNPAAGAHVDSHSVQAALRDGRHLLVDARAPERFVGSVEPIDPVAGHVPGAVNHPYLLNMSGDGHFLPPDELRRRWLERLAGVAPSAVIAMCGSGVTACHNLLALEAAGLPGAKLYPGSWSEWIRDRARPVARGSAY